MVHRGPSVWPRGAQREELLEGSKGWSLGLAQGGHMVDLGARGAERVWLVRWSTRGAQEGNPNGAWGPHVG